jgi:hypothetical protein
MALTHIHRENYQQERLSQAGAAAAAAAEQKALLAWAMRTAARGASRSGVVTAGDLVPGARKPVERKRTVNNATPLVRVAVEQQRGRFTVADIHGLVPEVSESAICNHLATLTKGGEIVLLNPGERPRIYRRATGSEQKGTKFAKTEVSTEQTNQ